MLWAILTEIQVACHRTPAFWSEHSRPCPIAALACRKPDYWYQQFSYPKQ